MTEQAVPRAADAAGVPVMVADMNGDLSGLFQPGAPNGRITRRAGSALGREIIRGLSGTRRR